MCFPTPKYVTQVRLRWSRPQKQHRRRRGADGRRLKKEKTKIKNNRQSNTEPSKLGPLALWHWTMRWVVRGTEVCRNAQVACMPPYRAARSQAQLLERQHIDLALSAQRSATRSPLVAPCPRGSGRRGVLWSGIQGQKNQIPSRAWSAIASGPDVQHMQMMFTVRARLQPTGDGRVLTAEEQNRHHQNARVKNVFVLSLLGALGRAPLRRHQQPLSCPWLGICTRPPCYQHLCLLGSLHRHIGRRKYSSDLSQF